MIASTAKHASALCGTLFATASAVVNFVTDALPHLATFAAIFSGFAAGLYYLRQIFLSFRKRAATRPPFPPSKR